MNSASQLNISLTKGKGLNYSVIDFVGEFDSYNIKEKKKSLLEMAKSFDRRYLVFNFANLIFINSEAISLLLEISEMMSADNKKLVIVNAKRNVLDVLKVIGLLESVPYYKSLEEFLKSISQ